MQKLRYLIAGLRSVFSNEYEVNELIKDLTRSKEILKRDGLRKDMENLRKDTENLRKDYDKAAALLTPESTMRHFLNKKKEIEANAIKQIPLEQCHFETFVNELYYKVHLRKGKAVISGMGKAGQIGNTLATTLSSTGTPAVFLHPSEAQHGDLGLIQKSDVLILISNSGKTDEVLALLELAKKRFALSCLAILGDVKSPLARAVEGYLTTGQTEEICPLGLTPTTSTTCMSVLCDLLVVAMMDKINFTREEYALCHHSGYLGQKAKKNPF